jgi:hypothetical protein
LGAIFLGKSAPASVATPAAGQAALFIDNTVSAAPLPCVKDETGGLIYLPRGLAAIVAASAGINSTETVVASATIPANAMNIGTTYRLLCSGVCTSTVANASNFRARIGTTTLTGVVASVVTPTAAASGTAIPFFVELIVTLRTIGSSGTAIGSGFLNNNGVTGVSAAAVVVGQVVATVTVNTTVQNLLELTYGAAAATTTCTFHNAIIEVLKT